MFYYKSNQTNQTILQKSKSRWPQVYLKTRRLWLRTRNASSPVSPVRPWPLTFYAIVRPCWLSRICSWHTIFLRCVFLIFLRCVFFIFLRCVFLFLWGAFFIFLRCVFLYFWGWGAFYETELFVFVVVIDWLFLSFIVLFNGDGSSVTWAVER